MQQPILLNAFVQRGIAASNADLPSDAVGLGTRWANTRNGDNQGLQDKLTVADAWSAPYVESGVMSQTGFGELCARIELAEMSFEACYLMYLLVPDVEDVMTVCSSQSALQKAVEGLGCRLVSDCPPKLRSKKAAMVGSFDMHSFQPFFRWMFDMGKSISAMNTGAHVGVVRSVPVEVSKMRPTP